jgi:hypothetical protein
VKKSFEFSYCLDEVEEITDNENITESESENVLITLIENNKISIGERTKGTISFDDSVQPIVYHLDYEYCSQVGVDWYDDDWEEVQEQVQL